MTICLSEIFNYVEQNTPDSHRDYRRENLIASAGLIRWKDRWLIYLRSVCISTASSRSERTQSRKLGNSASEPSRKENAPDSHLGNLFFELQKTNLLSFADIRSYLKKSTLLLEQFF